MALRRPSSPRGRLTRNVAIAAAGLVAILTVIASAAFDYRRAGHFPHGARDVLGPVSAILRLSHASELTRVPIAGFPLWEEGDRLAKAGDTTQARALIRESIRSDPQLFDARAWLAADAVKTGHFADAIRHFDWLYTIDEEARPRLVPLIAALARLPRAQRPVTVFVASHKPLWIGDVSDQLTRDNADPAVVFQLASAASGQTPSASEAGSVSHLVGSLAARKDYEGAYLAWVASLPQSAMGAAGYVYDRDFRQLPGALPFNWVLFDSPAASVDFLKGGGVDISYYGDAPAHLMEQMLLLPRGRFKFVALAGNSGTHDVNHVTWSIVCVGQPAAPLGRIDVPIAPAPVTKGLLFDVPDRCPAQMLALDGTPAEYPAAADVQIKAVAITRNARGS